MPAVSEIPTGHSSDGLEVVHGDIGVTLDFTGLHSVFFTFRDTETKYSTQHACDKSIVANSSKFDKWISEKKRDLISTVESMKKQGIL